MVINVFFVDYGRHIRQWFFHSVAVEMVVVLNHAERDS